MQNIATGPVRRTCDEIKRKKRRYRGRRGGGGSTHGEEKPKSDEITTTLIGDFNIVYSLGVGVLDKTA